jgi:hypothetical protein
MTVYRVVIISHKHNYLVVLMTAYHHSIYCDLIHNEDVTNKKKQCMHMALKPVTSRNEIHKKFGIKGSEVK